VSTDSGKWAPHVHVRAALHQNPHLRGVIELSRQVEGRVVECVRTIRVGAACQEQLADSDSVQRRGPMERREFARPGGVRVRAAFEELRGRIFAVEDPGQQERSQAPSVSRVSVDARFDECSNRREIATDYGASERRFL